ncbi:MAG: 16S rRNA (guanine(527)-N(7))-methyltransferase RsmG [Lachnospiraceae bacterium]|nr:16S rRNA (guanine(527)-N(7))-methyltransferase RsmG [Lachnospiraceae bacterium]
MMNSFEEFQTVCQEQLDLELSDDQINMFHVYYDLLIEWNQKMNLTAITELPDVLMKHFYDSVSLCKFYGEIRTETLSVIDVGTGAGFPGIPLKIAFPNLKITLLDSLQKRVGFLNEVINSLGLTEIEAVHGRAEVFGRDQKYRDQYDLCVSRAVANFATLSELCLPFLRMGGCFISYKSEKAAEELQVADKALFLLKGKVERVKEFTLPDTDMNRTFVVVKKTAPTPKPYPRKAGTPAKSPLS